MVEWLKLGGCYWRNYVEYVISNLVSSNLECSKSRKDLFVE